MIIKISQKRFLISRQKKFGPEFLKNTKKNASVNLKSISNYKLVRFCEQYEKEYKRIYSNYFPILGVEDYLLSHLTSYLFNEFSDKKIALDYFNKLTTEPKAMVSLSEKIGILKIAIAVIKNKEWLKIFNLSDSEEIIKKEIKLYRLIKSHERKWFWITRGYEGNVLTFNDFAKKIKDSIKLNPAKELKVIQEKNYQLKKELKKIKIDKTHKLLFKSVRDGIILKELRKSIVSKSLYYYDPILKEIAQRGGLSLYQTKFLKTSDIEEMLMKNKDFTHILNERIKLSVYLFSNGIAKIIVGKKAENEFNKYCKLPKKTDKIKGFAASPGKVSGRVRIILDISKIDKIKKGEIIVTVNAESDFSTAIIRAAALITDGGTGVTSHPATLAREAGIPCVIDTKIATQVLKDGDLVEVDGFNGIIKLLKK